MARRAPLLGGRFALGVLAAAGALTVLIVAVSALRAADAGPGAPDQAEPLPVRGHAVIYVSAADIETAFPGLVEARRSSALGFETGGRIAEVTVDVGDRVAAGAALARLDVRALEAARASARAEAAAAEAQARLAEVTLTRQRALVDQGHVSAQALDASEADFNAARARAAAARARADQIAVQIDLARLDAPYDGVVTARHFDEGAVAGPGAPVLTLAESGVLEIRVGLPAGAARRLDVGAVYPFEIDGDRRPARLRAVTGVIHPGGRTVDAVFDIEAPDLESGAVARLILETSLDQRGFWAPVTALAEGRRGLWSVYALVEENGAARLEPRPVEILHTQNDRVYLSGAVEDGAQILAAGVHRVAPGQRVIARTGG
ncbi:MAG: efflux RND transporter periplasmic adaptor subunit [Oceanicaulis sp.]